LFLSLLIIRRGVFPGTRSLACMTNMHSLGDRRINTNVVGAAKVDAFMAQTAFTLVVQTPQSLGPQAQVSRTAACHGLNGMSGVEFECGNNDLKAP
jgi:hypothetical protein